MRTSELDQYVGELVKVTKQNNAISTGTFLGRCYDCIILDIETSLGFGILEIPYRDIVQVELKL